jgi:predicted AAA+ superfamily ATPase
MAYFKKISSNETPKPPPLCINVDGTAGTGKSSLIWAITHALWDMYSNEMIDNQSNKVQTFNSLVAVVCNDTKLARIMPNFLFWMKNQ